MISKIAPIFIELMGQASKFKRTRERALSTRDGVSYQAVSESVYTYITNHPKLGVLQQAFRSLMILWFSGVVLLLWASLPGTGWFTTGVNKPFP